VTQPAVRRRVEVTAVRVGRRPDPLRFVPLAYQSWEGRDDDPDRTPGEPCASLVNAYDAWIEALGRFRPHDDLWLPCTTSSTRTATRA
jgi:hypothetical protein